MEEKKKPQVLVLSTQEDDWEQLWINGKLRDEGHHIDKNDIWRKGIEYGFGPDDIVYRDLDDEDEERAMKSGSMPNNAFEKYYKI